MRSLPSAVSRFSWLAFLAIATSCAHVGAGTSSARSASEAPQLARPRVLVVGVDLETPIDGVSSDALSAALGEGFAGSGGLEPVPLDGVVGATVAPECRERLACLRELGQTAGCQFVAATTLVGLGDTAMLRVRFVHVDASGGEQTRQAVVQPADELTLASALRDVGAALAAPFVPETARESPQASRRWRWLGPSLATLVVAGVVTTVVLTRENDPGPDVVITPP